MIKQIIFDCGNVLVELHFRDLMLEVSGSQEMADYFMERLWQPDSPWLSYDRGDLNTQEVLAAMKTNLPTQYHSYLERFMDKWLEAMPPMPGMEELVDVLKSSGYPCYLLSNFSEGFAKMPERIPVLQKLDGMVISYQVHMLKPDPRIYQYTIDALGLVPEETLFVDDNLQNVEAAKREGLKAYRFTTTEDFRTYLYSHGILETGGIDV